MSRHGREVAGQILWLLEWRYSFVKAAKQYPLLLTSVVGLLLTISIHRCRCSAIAKRHGFTPKDFLQSDIARAKRNCQAFAWMFQWGESPTNGDGSKLSLVFLNLVTIDTTQIALVPNLNFTTAPFQNIQYLNAATKLLGRRRYLKHKIMTKCLRKFFSS